MEFSLPHILPHKWQYNTGKEEESRESLYLQMINYISILKKFMETCGNNVARSPSPPFSIFQQFKPMMVCRTGL